MSPSFAAERERMVAQQLEGRGIRDPRVLSTMRGVPRHLFVDPSLRDRAYDDGPLPIGQSQTISQPYMVALMTEALGLAGSERVLEVGTGSGYQAAVLAELAAEVITLERIPELAARARALLGALGLDRVHVYEGDGTLGWPERAPYDGIVVSAAAPPQIPRPLLEQLASGGRLVIPMGEEALQTLVRIVKRPEGISEEYLGECRFVKLRGCHGWEG